MTSRRAEGGRKGNGGKRRRTEAAAKTTLTEIMAHLQQIYIYYIYTLYCVVRKEQKRVQHLNFAAAARSNKLWQRQYQRGRQKGSGKQEGGGEEKGHIESADCATPSLFATKWQLQDDYERQSAVPHCCCHSSSSCCSCSSSSSCR